MPDANRVDPHLREPLTELIEEVNHAPAGIFATPGAESDYPAETGSRFADIDHRLRRAAADIDARHQWTYGLCIDGRLEGALLGAFQPIQPKQRILGLIGKARQHA